ncbi:MAG TPA: VWA domain-containing protein [Myxococcota bacterium]|jgi:hypothetical protein|nr:VWA domain-containing protein [Myxococcota bacterium]
MTLRRAALLSSPLWLPPLWLLAAARPVAADSLNATLGQPLHEVSHTVDVRFGDGVATLTVRRTFANAGTIHEEATVEIALPDGAVAVGLRTFAHDTWYAGELMDAVKADGLYEQLTGLGVSTPREPTILKWSSPGALHMQIFPVPPGGTSTVEYTLLVPVDYADGLSHVYYPAGNGAAELTAPIVRLHPARPGARVLLDGRLARADTPVALRSSDADHTVADLAAAPAAIDTVALRLAHVVAATGAGFVRFEMDAAPRLRPLPKNLSVVFVVDASYSEGAAGIDAQLTLAEAFLRHVPDADFDLVAYRRTASRLLGVFTAAGDFGDAVTGARASGLLAPGNGSALDEGLRAAAAALRGRKGPKTIVALTDDLLREGLGADALRSALAGAGAGTVVHVVVREEGPAGDVAEAGEWRDDDHPFAPVAAAHGGIVLHAFHGAAVDAGAWRTVALGLVRPVRIDRLRISGLDAADAGAGTDDGDGEGDDGLPKALREGEGVRVFLPAAAAPTAVVVTGAIWGKPFRRVVRADPALERETAALVFSAGLHTELDDGAMKRLALAGRAVSPVTSYLAIEPGVRPSTAGIARGADLGTLFGSAIGHAYGAAGIDYYSEGGIPLVPDPKPRLAAAMAPCRRDAAAPAIGWKATVRLETTRDEIVAVDVAGVSGAFARCVAEAAWGMRLDGAYRDDHHAFTVALP